MSEATADELQLTQSMLESSWDDIEDLPEFALFPIGSYQFLIEKMTAEPNQDKTKMQVKVLCSLREAIEVAEGQQYEIETPIEGALVMQTYGGEFGIKKFKKDWQEVALAVGANGPAELIEMAANMDVMIQMGIRPDKEKKDPETGQPVLYNEFKAILPA